MARLQPVFLGANLQCFSDLVSLHWLQLPERVMFKVAVLMFKAIHGSAPTYLSWLVRVTIPGHLFLHSACSNRVLFLSIRLSTVSDRTFLVAGPSIWNNLPDTVTSAPTLYMFRPRLKTYLFSLFFPDIILDQYYITFT